LIDRVAEWVASAAGGELVAGAPAMPGPRRAVVDSRDVRSGDLFVGLPGAHADGGAFAAQALAAGAWGVLVGPRHADPRLASGAGVTTAAATAATKTAATTTAATTTVDASPGQAVIRADDPLGALASLATAWRRELACPAVGITGSTGKTSTKAILAAMLAPARRTHASRDNLNTEVGLPLALLEADRGTEVLVLEMAMRGAGQIAELVAIAEPDVGVIVNVGPAHLELLGTIEAVALAKAELVRDLPAGAACVVPAREPLLAPHLRDDIETITFGPDGDVRLRSFADGVAQIDARGELVELELSYDEQHNLLNTLAAVGAALVLGVKPAGRVAPVFAALRGELVELPGGVTVVNDCYNANPMSMRAAIDHLAASPAGRRITVLGAMAELGSEAGGFHRQIGEHAAQRGVDVMITVGERAIGYSQGFAGETYSVASPEEAATLLEELALAGDRVLIKGSRSAGLERVLS